MLMCSGELIEVRNPRSGQIDYRFNAPSANELSTTIQGLRAAQTAWA
ncbi:MAG: hypothetical protein RLY72_1352, partial [Planctomycetota bacterium]